MASALCRKNPIHSFVRILRRQRRHMSVDDHKVTSGILNTLTNINAHGLMDRDEILSERVEVNGARLHYERVGNGNHVLLLLPGALGSTRTDFGPQLDKLDRTKFTVLAWDPRGYGKSIPPSRDWPMDFLRRDAHDAAGLMKVLGYDRYSLLGWSDGGNSAMILAANYPDQVRKLVIWGCNAFVAQGDVELFEAVRDIDNWSERMRKPFIDVYGEPYFREQWVKWTDAYMAIYKDNEGEICRGDLKNICCPTLLLHGGKDPMVPQYQPNYLIEHIKGIRTHIFPEGKHNIHLRYADKFNQIVTDFLQEQEDISSKL